MVTKLTLAEAEAFAEEHGFNPLCFVAIPEEASFGGEPFFGQTTRADEHMPSGAALERDDSPVRIIGRIELPRGPVAAEPDAAAHAAPVEAPPADMAEPDEMTDEPAEPGKALPVGLPEARESPEPHVVAADLPAAAPADEPVALPGADTALTLPDAPAAEPSVGAHHPLAKTWPSQPRPRNLRADSRRAGGGPRPRSPTMKPGRSDAGKRHGRIRT